MEATVPEARDYQLVYDLNLAKLARDIVYDEDRQAKITRPFDRIAYFIELRRNEGELQYLYVSMAAFTTDIKKIGVPAFATGASFQMNVANMNVYSNVKRHRHRHGDQPGATSNSGRTITLPATP